MSIESIDRPPKTLMLLRRPAPKRGMRNRMPPEIGELLEELRTRHARLREWIDALSEGSRAQLAALEGGANGSPRNCRDRNPHAGRKTSL